MIGQVICLCGFFTARLAATVSITTEENQRLWNDTATDKLKQHILEKYDSQVRPTEWNATKVQVEVIVKTVDLDENANMMVLNFWMAIFWVDDKLKWNPSDYDGLEKLVVSPFKIWVPDIYLANRAGQGSVSYRFRNTHCLVKKNGDVAYTRPSFFRSTCPLDFTYWPFGEYTCTLVLLSFGYGGNEIDLGFLEPSDKEITLREYEATSEWTLLNVTAKRKVIKHDCCFEERPSLQFEFRLSRNSQIYHHVIFVPTVPIVFLTLSTFWLSPKSNIKLMTNASITIIVVLYLIYFAFKVPSMCHSLPLIVKFYIACLYQATMSMIVAIIVMNINKVSCYTAIPLSIHQFLHGKAGRYLGLGNLLQEIESLKKKIAKQQTRDSNITDVSVLDPSLFDLRNNQQSLISAPASRRTVLDLEWILLATAIDRVVFLTFCLIFMVLALCFI